MLFALFFLISDSDHLVATNLKSLTTEVQVEYCTYDFLGSLIKPNSLNVTFFMIQRINFSL